MMNALMMVTNLLLIMTRIVNYYHDYWLWIWIVPSVALLLLPRLLVAEVYFTIIKDIIIIIIIMNMMIIKVSESLFGLRRSPHSLRCKPGIDIEANTCRWLHHEHDYDYNDDDDNDDLLIMMTSSLRKVRHQQEAKTCSRWDDENDDNDCNGYFDYDDNVNDQNGDKYDDADENYHNYYDDID